MRRPGGGGLVGEGLPAPPPVGVIAHSRLGFGHRPGDLAAFEALGANDPDRLQAYIDQQLDPASIDDSELEARLTAAGFDTLDKPLAQLWQEHAVADPPWEERIRPAVETTYATFMRAIWSRRQLVEVLADFWHNHFNVYGWEFWQAPIWVHYDRDVIRPHVLGNFRQMLEADAQAAEMLFYLDLWVNSEEGPNENYPRELFELHTLGSENYMGVIPQEEVPLDGQGRPVAFVDEDIFEATRCLTGWSVEGDPWWDPTTGNAGFLYRSNWHDGGDKHVLGVDIPAGQADLQDGLDVLDALAEHPGTGRHIAGKLARRLIGDHPDQAMVDQAAQVFHAAWTAPDQIAQTVRVILEHPSFATTWGDKVKRPFEVVSSALRASAGEMPFEHDNPTTDTFYWMYWSSGHPLFAWRPPNGYPEAKEDWLSTTPRALGWRISSWLTDARDENDVNYLDVLSQTPVGVRSANALADFWIDRILGRSMAAADRQEIVDFMAQGHNPEFDLPLDTEEPVQERLRALVGLLFMSSDFLWR